MGFISFYVRAYTYIWNATELSRLARDLFQQLIPSDLASKHLLTHSPRLGPFRSRRRQINLELVQWWWPWPLLHHLLFLDCLVEMLRRYSSAYLNYRATAVIVGRGMTMHRRSVIVRGGCRCCTFHCTDTCCFLLQTPVACPVRFNSWIQIAAVPDDERKRMLNEILPELDQNELRNNMSHLCWERTRQNSHLKSSWERPRSPHMQQTTDVGSDNAGCAAATPLLPISTPVGKGRTRSQGREILMRAQMPKMVDLEEKLVWDGEKIGPCWLCVEFVAPQLSIFSMLISRAFLLRSQK